MMKKMKGLLSILKIQVAIMMKMKKKAIILQTVTTKVDIVYKQTTTTITIENHILKVPSNHLMKTKKFHNQTHQLNKIEKLIFIEENLTEAKKLNKMMKLILTMKMTMMMLKDLLLESVLMKKMKISLLTVVKTIKCAVVQRMNLLLHW